MTFSLVCLHQPLIFPPSKTSIALQHHKNLSFFKQKLGSSHARIGQCVAVRCSFNLPSFHDFESGGDMARELFGRAEGLLYTIADAAVAASDASPDVVKPNRDWLSGITDSLEAVLKILKDGLSALHVPYAYGFAIILLTVLVKAATFPLTKKQVESAMAMRSLQPQIKAIQQLYAGDQERIKLETVRLYKLAGVNPLAGCLPTIMTMPIWIGLYRAFSNVANEGLLMEGFFWIPSLSGPTTIASRQNGTGISWLFPFVDGHPPLGWSNTFAYLVLPLLLVISQYISLQIMQPSQVNDPNQNGSPALAKFLPLMVGYFALSVPSGLSLYWLTSNILSTGQQIWLQQLGGAKNPVKQYNDTSFLNEPHIQKPVVNIDNKKLERSQTENSSPGVLHRGERFKQIKEQEAIRRQQREEESRRAEAVIGNVEHRQEPEFPKANDNAEAGFIAVEDKTVHSMTVIHDSMRAEAAAGNGEHKQEPEFPKANDNAEAGFIAVEDKTVHSMNVIHDSMKAEAAAGNSEHKREPEFPKANDNAEAGFIAVEDNMVHSMTVKHDSTDPRTPSVNAGEYSEDSQGDQTMLGDHETGNGVAYNSSTVVKDENNSYEGF